MPGLLKKLMIGFTAASLSIGMLPPFAVSSSFELSLPASEQSSRDVIVVFSADATENERSVLLSSLNKEALIWQAPSSALVRFSFENADAGLAFLRESPVVSAADYDDTISLCAISQDAYTNTQWGLDNPGTYSYISSTRTSVLPSTVDIDMNIPEAWKRFAKAVTSPREVVVAILDTGVDIKHPDLAANIWVNRSEIPGDGIDNDNNGFVDDIHGWDFYHGDNTLCHYDSAGTHFSASDNDNHGTHVAGIIAAVRDNEIGIAGVASCADVRIMPLKIHGGPNGSGTISNAILAIEYATAMGADICNLSWGTDKQNDALAAAIRASDMLFICAAGNSGTDNDVTPLYPANYNYGNVISVAYTDANGLLTPLSNYGAKSVDIAAPGVDIYSTCVGGYQTMSGSSMATPHVAGVAALLYSFGDRQYPANVKKVLLKHVKALPSANADKLLKNAFPDADAAIKARSELRYDYAAPTLSFTPGFSGDKLTLTVKATDTGKSGVRTIRYASKVRDLSYFKRGTFGDVCRSGKAITLPLAGKYTFYVSDYAGNERIITYNLADDMTPPTAMLSYQVSFDYSTFTVKVAASDSESGVHSAKYAPGTQEISYFLSGTQGTEIKLTKSSGSFKVTKEGIYTVFLTDNRGNKSVQTINVRSVPATSITMQATSKTLKAGDTWQIITNVLPKGSTDALQYTSSNEDVCKVSSSGKLTAIGAGRASVTVRTASGYSCICRITVTE